MQAAIIGSGIAGLAAAVRLAVKGYKVTVYEQNAYPGGKLSSFEQDGFRFDAGPSLLATPHLIEELFLVAGKNPADYFNYTKLKNSCNYFYPDGSKFTATSDLNQFTTNLTAVFNSTDINKIEEYLNNAAFKYNITSPLFLEQSLHQLKNYLNLNTLKGILNAWRLNLFSTMHEQNSATFSDARLTQYFNRFATYNGSNPYKAPALLNLIAHLEHHYGTYIPKHGMHQITDSVYRLAINLGVNFRFNQKVLGINTYKNGLNQKVSGITTNEGSYAYDVVVSNADIYFTYTKLLPHIKPPVKLLNQEKSSSALIFYWGINRLFNELDLHNIFFSGNYEEEFDAIFNKKLVYHDPTVYVNITSKYVPGDAPDGCENWFVMINVPHKNTNEKSIDIATARTNIINKLSQMLGVDIGSTIVTENILTPDLIEKKTGSYLGALYGNSSNNRYAAFLRHKNFSGKVKGLYFCGGSVHPGGGIPLCLYSAKIVADNL